MSYLDPKEDVIDLKLTSYGKYLLSIGKLNPTFYAFFDDDVIYDIDTKNLNYHNMKFNELINNITKFLK